MARIRTIKPDFWTDEKLVECSPTARLFFIGMWNFADDSGNLARSSKKLKMQILPSDNVDAECLVMELINQGVLVEYSVCGEKYLHIKGFTKHQKIDHPTKSTIPAIALVDASDVLANPRESSLSKGREGNIEERKEENIDTQAPNALAAKKTKPKQIPLPANWSPNDEHRAKCQSLGLNASELGEQFVNDRLAKGVEYVDWDRGFFTWIGNAPKFGGNKTGRGNSQQTTASIVEVGLRLADRGRRNDEQRLRGNGLQGEPESVPF
jgi:hypothetical protein